MSRLAVLRPEPGNAATAAALEAGGHDVRRLPLFAIRPLAWTPPDPARFDALLLTSANAARHAGAGLAVLRGLPVVAVGEATAAAARAAGLRVVATGGGDAVDALGLARAHGFARPLHLTGREHRPAGDVAVVETYASEAIAVAPAALDALAGRVALLHSPRAARRLAALLGAGRGDVAIAGLSAAVIDAAGPGWRATAAAAAPADAALRDAAVTLAAAIDPSDRCGDKRS